MSTPQRSMVILAEGKFSLFHSKTANQAIRYIPEEVVAVIDSTQAGKTAHDVLGFGGAIPVVAGFRAALPMKPTTLLIGIAPPGGRLPDAWRATVREAIEHRLDVISGLHSILSDDEELRSLACRYEVTINDLRKIPPEYEVVSQGSWRARKGKTILTVGSDCNVGKMTASLELHREFLRRNLSSDFVPTGQTGILLAGKGIAVDSIISDYVSGSIEREVNRSEDERNEFIHVEGQGSLTHQGYSSVTLGLIHGVMPDAMIMVHHPARRVDNYGLSIETVQKFITLHEMILEPFKQSKVVGIALNPAQLNEKGVETVTRSLEAETGLPVADVLTAPGVAKLADALVLYFNTIGRRNA